MKRLILMALAVTLALGIIWVPSVAAADPVPITIHKTIPSGGPAEDFTFEAWRDKNNNNVIDAGDKLVGTVIITGAGTGIINSAIKGKTIIHEVLVPGSAYEQQPDQIVQVDCPVEVTFDNELGDKGELIIEKVDGTGNALAGATFIITPDPKTGAGSLTVVDNGLNDEDPTEGVLLVTGCIIGTVCTVEETVAPPGYEKAAPQTVTISATVTLTFVDKPKKGICVLIADEDFIDNDGQAIEEAAKSHGVKASKMINDTGKRPTLDPSDGKKKVKVPTEKDNPWFLWNEKYFGDVVLLETGQIKDEGLFCLTDESLAELEKRGYSLEDFVYGRIPQSALDKVPGVMPLRNDCLRALVGQICIVVVYDSDISINYKPINANLQGARLGLTYLEFLDVVNPGTIKESTDSTSLLDIWVEVLPIPELPDPFPTEASCECAVQDQEPPDVSIKTAEWDSGTLTIEVEAKPLEGSSAKPVLNASYGKLEDNYPGINDGTTSETLIPVETPWIEIEKDIYRLVYPIAQNIEGWTITVSSSWGGAYNAEIK